jgi:fumarylacetoacetase
MIEYSNNRSWVEIDNSNDFSIHNFPFGIFKTNNSSYRPCSRLGDYIIDLNALNQFGFFSNLFFSKEDFQSPTLNLLFSKGRKKVGLLRSRLIEIFSAGNDELKNDDELKKQVMIPVSEVEMGMPIRIENYTDFYSSIEHATNVGKMFRDPENALLPNWRHIPVGYHGRASSIILSGVPVTRPKGQMKPDGYEKPIYGPSRLLDFELEMGFVICKENRLGEPIDIQDTEDYIIGMALFNDWSARDIQKWEYVPLGPFLGKNFASSISPWIVTLDALEYFKVPGPVQEPDVLPYLQIEGNRNFDIHLEVLIESNEFDPRKVSKSNFKYMYWNINQQLAHHTVNGCNVKVGDLYASGTISGHYPDSYGSMLELSWRGTKPVPMPDGSTRKFINDYDTVIMKGFCEKGNVRIGFGEVSSQVLPAN